MIDKAAGGAKGWQPNIQPGAPLAPRIEALIDGLPSQFKLWTPENSGEHKLAIECFPAEAIWAAKRMNYIHAKSICSDFRILMERIVETVFLADVVQRHRRSINTMGKIGSLVKINSADCNLVDEMMTKYSCYEHSQSSEAPVDVPDPDEIEKDIDRMVSWHSEFSKRV
ncbi:hypothetical protein [Rhodopirellula europaea]|uniref:hypothetical protein n=1 Tax=Rhodopirellula europaea TaxID=1263866 RepID=UPI001181AB2F|nr:hypothetical protein [Rhodopirellula europaea]